MKFHTLHVIDTGAPLCLEIHQVCSLITSKDIPIHTKLSPVVHAYTSGISLHTPLS